MQDYGAKFHRLISTATGLAICAAAAGVASRLFAQSAWRSLVPLVFVLVLVALAAIYGTAVGVLGSVLSALIFSYWLYAPVGLHVADAAARSSLAWMIVGGVALSYLLGPGFHNPNQHHK
jgi:K+-sensing histidine kinase KdpD